MHYTQSIPFTDIGCVSFYLFSLSGNKVMITLVLISFDIAKPDFIIIAKVYFLDLLKRLNILHCQQKEIFCIFQLGVHICAFVVLNTLISDGL
jgi:hypothetical protein